jgi:hypothetical protein
MVRAAQFAGGEKVIAPRNQTHQVVAATKALFGSHRVMAVLYVVAILISVNLFSSAAYEWCEGKRQVAQLSALFLPALLVGLFFLVHQAVNALPPARIVVEYPREHRALILFLSPPQDLSSIESIQGSLHDPAVLAAFKNSHWRMPMTAIAHHLKKLERVVVIASADTSENSKTGTIHFYQTFREMAVRLAGKSTLSVVGTADIDPECKAGVDFEDTEALLNVIERVFVWLRKEKIEDADTILDVTGGRKVTTVAGAAATLAPDRKFQYVSPTDYKVRSFDLTYERS